VNEVIDLLVAGLLDGFPNAVFDEFLPSLPDCVLSDYDDGSTSKEETTNPESKPGNTEASRWGHAFASDYKIIRNGGV
jgi:hypothetical protein